MNKIVIVWIELQSRPKTTHSGRSLVSQNGERWNNSMSKTIAIKKTYLRSPIFAEKIDITTNAMWTFCLPEKRKKKDRIKRNASMLLWRCSLRTLPLNSAHTHTHTHKAHACTHTYTHARAHTHTSAHVRTFACVAFFREWRSSSFRPTRGRHFPLARFYAVHNANATSLFTDIRHKTRSYISSAKTGYSLARRIQNCLFATSFELFGLFWICFATEESFWFLLELWGVLKMASSTEAWPHLTRKRVDTCRHQTFWMLAIV